MTGPCERTFRLGGFQLGAVIHSSEKKVCFTFFSIPWEDVQHESGHISLDSSPKGKTNVSSITLSLQISWVMSPGTFDVTDAVVI